MTSTATSRWDDLRHVVKLVRTPDGNTFLVAIRCPHPWVLRKPVLVTEDVD